MKKTSTVALFLLVGLYGLDAYPCRPPDNANVNITREEISFSFSWDSAKGPTQCKAHEAVEFEFYITADDDTPKCFAQPLGGKDENQDNVADIDGFKGYTDVWNYYFDYTPEEVKAHIKNGCNVNVSDVFAQLASGTDYVSFGSIPFRNR